MTTQTENYIILDDNNCVKLVTQDEWIEWKWKIDRCKLPTTPIQETELGDVRIFTYFDDGMCFENHAPFRTLISGGAYNGHERGYQGHKAALEGHAEMVHLVENFKPCDWCEGNIPNGDVEKIKTSVLGYVYYHFDCFTYAQG